MANQTTTKPIELIKNLKIYVHGIPIIPTFTIQYNTILDSSYSILLGRSWFKDAKMAHDWGNKTLEEILSYVTHHFATRCNI